MLFLSLQLSLDNILEKSGHIMKTLATTKRVDGLGEFFAADNGDSQKLREEMIVLRLQSTDGTTYVLATKPTSRPITLLYIPHRLRIVLLLRATWLHGMKDPRR